VRSHIVAEDTEYRLCLAVALDEMINAGRRGKGGRFRKQQLTFEIISTSESLRSGKNGSDAVQLLLKSRNLPGEMSSVFQTHLRTLTSKEVLLITGASKATDSTPYQLPWQHITNPAGSH